MPVDDDVLGLKIIYVVLVFEEIFSKTSSIFKDYYELKKLHFELWLEIKLIMNYLPLTNTDKINYWILY